MSGPLAGIRVIDLTISVLGPLATQVLGDAGADVIKIEAPAGDPLRQIGPSRGAGMGSYFVQLNRNKRSVVLDLKRPAGRDALLRLIAGADVFVHNMRLGAIERLGLDYASLSRVNPRLIHASATGFAKSGPYRDRPAFDDLIQGMSGLAALNAAGGSPRYAPIVIADKICGHVLAGSIAMALFHRERTGQGQEVHVPMLETMLAFVLPEHMWHATTGEPERGVGYTRMLTPHRRPFPTKDGHICIIPLTDAQWQRLFEVIGRPELMQDPRFATIAARGRHADAVYEVVVQAMPARSTAEWIRLLDAADVPNGPVNTLEGLFGDEYLSETGFFQTLDDPSGGRLTLLGLPVAFSTSPTEIGRVPPRLGEHTESVLREAGLDEAAIAAARA